jgi:hypothetical protein
MEIEKLIANEVNDALVKVLKERLSSYGSPLQKMVDDVVVQNQSEIKELLKEGIKEAVTQEEFRKEIKSAFAHSLARSLMNEFKGEIEKQSNEMRRQPDFRARVVMAIEKIINET